PSPPRTHGKQDSVLARVRLLQSTGPGALARRGADPGAGPAGVRRRPAEEVAAEPLPAVPRFPGGQAGLRLHPVGHPVILAARLAAALLPAGRRVRPDLPGPPPGDPPGRLPPPPAPPLPPPTSPP